MKYLDVFRVVTAALVLFLATHAVAATEAGKILYSRGIVSIVDAQDSRRGGSTGAPVYEGDHIITGRGALAQIRLSDGALIALRSDTDYLIEKQRMGETESLSEQAGKLFTGWMRSITGTIGQKYPQRVSQKTSVATIGIRGTVYQVISIPPEGLPDFPGEAPGTYVLLEQGEINLTGEAGSRLLKPGDIVFIPAAGGAPQLTPDKLQLFRQLDRPPTRIDSLDDQGRFDRQLNETLSDQLKSGTVGAAVSWGPFASAGDVIFGNELEIVGTDASRRLTHINFILSDGGTYYSVDANKGATPLDTGSYTLASGTLVNWGVWSSNDYTVRDGAGVVQSPSGQDWHYMVSDYVIPSADAALSGGLRGTMSYNYVGGTTLTGGAGNVVINSGAMTIDFASTAVDIYMDVSPSLAAPTFLTNENSGLDPLLGNLQSLYEGGIYVYNDPGNTTFFGYVQGALVDGGDAVITNVQAGNGSFSQGTALFEAAP